MEWDPKLSSWDLEELGQNPDAKLGSIIGFGSQIGGQACSIDLNLGELGNSAPPDRLKNQARVSATAARSTKRARLASSQSASCLAEGCNSDLSNCREYNRRHKVCEIHSKTPVVIVDGQEQRFCQQCSRFHLLADFDGMKRSCRKRLDGHNRRRRKPQPESMIYGSFFANSEVNHLFNYPSIFPTDPPEPNWSSIIKTEEYALHNGPSMHFAERQQPFSISFSDNTKEIRPLSFLHDNANVLSGRTTLQASAGNSRIFHNRLTGALNSDCALSLLSSPTPNSFVSVDQMLLPEDRIPVGQSLVSGLQYSVLGRFSGSRALNTCSSTRFSCSEIEDKHLGTVLVSDACNGDLHHHDLFHDGGEGSSDGKSKSLPFC